MTQEGLIHTRPGLGVYVARPKAELTKKVRRERLVHEVDTLLTEAVHLAFSAEEVVTLVSDRAQQFQWLEERTSR